MANPMELLTNFMRMGNNPQQIVQTLMSNNPQAQALVNQVKQSGMTPQQFLNQYCKQNNIDAKPIIQMLTNKGIKL